MANINMKMEFVLNRFIKVIFATKNIENQSFFNKENEAILKNRFDNREYMTQDEIQKLDDKGITTRFMLIERNIPVQYNAMYVFTDEELKTMFPDGMSIYNSDEIFDKMNQNKDINAALHVLNKRKLTDQMYKGFLLNESNFFFKSYLMNNAVLDSKGESVPSDLEKFQVMDLNYVNVDDMQLLNILNNLVIQNKQMINAAKNMRLSINNHVVYLIVVVINKDVIKRIIQQLNDEAVKKFIIQSVEI